MKMQDCYNALIFSVLINMRNFRDFSPFRRHRLEKRELSDVQVLKNALRVMFIIMYNEL